MKQLLRIMVPVLITVICCGCGGGGDPWTFEHRVIDPDPAGDENDVCLPGDLDGDGDLDILQKDFQEQTRVDVWLND